MTTLSKRHEIVFIYDTKLSNPNGDPTENNELRMIGDKLYVTDVRLKRTIRDYLSTKGKEVFVKEVIDNDGKVLDGMGRLADKLGIKKSEMDKKPLTKDQLSKLQEFIDIRCFGSAIKVKMTGAVQFNFGESLHSVEQVKVQWTTVFSSGDWKGQGTFTEAFITPYALISFCGVANEQAALSTGMTDQDFEEIKDALWDGTKNLVTRSKFGQLPRILIDVVFKEGEKTHIGELDKYITLIGDNDELFISDISDVKFDFTALIERLEKFVAKIEKVNIILDERVIDKGLSSEILTLSITRL